MRFQNEFELCETVSETKMGVRLREPKYIASYQVGQVGKNKIHFRAGLAQLEEKAFSLHPL